MTIRSDDRNVRTSHADLCQIAMSPDEFVLHFAKTDGETAPGRPVDAVISSRIIMSPSTAKRLAWLLADATVVDAAQSLPAPAPVVEAPRRAVMPLPRQVVEDLGAEYLLVHSFKALHRTLLGNRFLLTVAKSKIAGSAHERILAACERMQMPDPLRQVFAEHVDAANYLHVGLEENELTSIHKMYLEFWTTWEDELDRKRRAEPFLGGLGFKWDASDPAQHVITRYTCHPRISVEQMLQRVSDIYAGGHETAIGLTKRIVDLAAARLRPDRILYLEAAEDGNPRLSFDINVVQADIRLHELHDVMAELQAHYELDAEQFRALYDRAKDERFAHILGGVDRHGRDFISVYYGQEWH